MKPTTKKPMKPATKVLVQLRTLAGYNLITTRRNPTAAFFTVGLPLLLLLIFTAIFGNDPLYYMNGAPVGRFATFYVPGILALATVSATLVNIPISNTYRREAGLLKRLRGSPLRPSTYIASELIAGFVLVLVIAVLLSSLGWIVYDVSIRLAAVPSILLTLFVAAISFGAMGLAVCTLIKSETAAPAVTNLLALPLYFISDIFYQTRSNFPKAVTFIADFFPVKHLSGALGVGFDPQLTGTPIAWENLFVIMGWGVFGALIALWKFEWLPRGR